MLYSMIGHRIGHVLSDVERCVARDRQRTAGWCGRNCITPIYKRNGAGLPPHGAAMRWDDG